jgi:hypothetical protein
MDSLTAWIGDVQSTLSTGILDTNGQLTIANGDAAAALTLARKHNAHIHRQTRTLLHVNGPELTRVLLTVDAIPGTDLATGIARALLHWDTYATTGTFPATIDAAAGVRPLGSTDHACELVRSVFAGEHRLRSWTDIAEQCGRNAQLANLDAIISLNARGHTVAGSFGEPHTPASDTEELLARLIADRSGLDHTPIAVRLASGTPDIMPDALKHADLIDVVHAERRLTISAAARRGHDAGTPQASRTPGTGR